MEILSPELATVLAAVVAFIIPIVASERIRRIVKDIFRRPTSRTIVLKIGDETIEINNVSAEAQRRLVDAWISRHSASTEDKTATPPKDKDGRDE